MSPLHSLFIVPSLLPSQSVVQPVPRRRDSKWSLEFKYKSESKNCFLGLFSYESLKRDHEQ